MSMLKNYLATEQELERVKRRLVALQNDPKLQAEIEFKDKLTELMDTYNKTPRDVLELLEPDAASSPRKKREPKTYKNPHTGEVVKTAGPNRTLRDWRSEYGKETVDGWQV